MNSAAKGIILWAALVFVLILLWNFYSKLKDPSVEVSFTEFYQYIHDKKIKSVKLAAHEAEGELTDGSKFRVFIPAGAQWDLAKELHVAGARVEVSAPEQGAAVYNFFSSWLPFIVILGFWIFLMRQMKRPKQ